jgi:hypothetical protein
VGNDFSNLDRELEAIVTLYHLAQPRVAAKGTSQRKGAAYQTIRFIR